MAVAGDPKDRCGIVVAKNELAKKAGVKTTDTIWQARQKCPNILFVPPHHDEYARVSRRMNAISANIRISWSLLRLTNRIWT